MASRHQKHVLQHRPDKPRRRPRHRVRPERLYRISRHVPGGDGSPPQPTSGAGNRLCRTAGPPHDRYPIYRSSDDAPVTVSRPARLLDGYFLASSPPRRRRRRRSSLSHVTNAARRRCVGAARATRRIYGRVCGVFGGPAAWRRRESAALW